MNRKEETLMLPGPIAFHLLFQKKKAWKNLTAYYHEDPHLDCPILPATLSNTLEEVLFIFCLYYPGDNNFDEMTERKRILW